MVAKVLGMLLSGGLVVGAVGCGVAPDAEQVETAALAATSTSTMPSPTIVRCAGGTFQFNGACRDLAWVRATFGSAVVGGYGWREKDSTAGMVLLERSGDPASPEGVTITATQLAETTTTLKPAREGYEIVEVRTVSLAFPAGGTVYRYQSVLQPRMVRLGTWRLRVVDWDSVTWYRSGGSLVCDPSGCSEPIASSSSVSDSAYCADVVDTLENVDSLMCTGSLFLAGGILGCLGGAIGVAAGPEVTVGLCLGGATLGLEIGNTFCPTLADYLVPDADMQSTCESVMADIEGTTTDSSIILSAPPDITSGSSTGASCSGTYDSVTTYEAGGDCCQTTETHQCSGTYDSSGRCWSTGACSIQSTATVCTSGGC